MNTKLEKLLVLAVLFGGLFASTSFAATVATAAVTPSITVPGGKVFIHTAVSNLTLSNQAVSVTLNITNPGTCVTGHLPSPTGTFAFGLKRNETRLADLSLRCRHPQSFFFCFSASVQSVMIACDPTLPNRFRALFLVDVQFLRYHSLG